VRVFGSLARGEGTENSDLDLLVTLEERRSLLDLVGLKQDIEDLLHRQVDVVTEPALSPTFESTSWQKRRRCEPGRAVPAHILDAIQKIERYVEVGHDEFMAESLRHDAVIRELEIIGEAAKRLSPEVLQRSADVPGARWPVCATY